MSRMFDFGELSEEDLKALNEEERKEYAAARLRYYRRHREVALAQMREWYRKNKEHKAIYDHEHKDERWAIKKAKLENSEEGRLIKIRASLRNASKRPVGCRGRVTKQMLAQILKEELAGRVRRYINHEENMKLKILCIVGESGTGKTLASLHLKNKLGANVICSYTTRPPRDTEVEGREHHFIDIVPPEEELLAFAKFGKFSYYATKGQVFGPCTVYVIDEQGVRDLIQRNSNEFEIFTVYLQRDKRLRLDQGITQFRMDRDQERDLFDLSFYNYVVENNGSKRELFSNIERIYNEVKNK